MARIVYIVTASLTARKLLRGQLAYMRQQGFDVHVIAGDSQYLSQVACDEGVTTHHVPMQREISWKADLQSLRDLKSKLKELKPDLVNASTPKAGLLGMMAARATGVKARVYVLRGLRLETLSGVKRQILTRTEKMTSARAHRVVCVSHSLKKEAIERGLVSERKSLVIGSGSSNGVIVERFVETPERLAASQSLRERLNLNDDAVVIGFVGRFTRDKGMVELMEGFSRAYVKDSRLVLLLIGDYEPGDPVPDETRKLIESSPGVYRAGFLEDTAPAYLAMNALCLPTYREGFPNVPIEAAAAGVPTIGSDATGVVDAVVDRITGWIVPVGNAQALAERFLEVAASPDQARHFGSVAKERALREFPPERIWEGLANLYRELL